MIHEHDRQTDGRTLGDSIYRTYAYASRGKNEFLVSAKKENATFFFSENQRKAYTAFLMKTSAANSIYQLVTSLILLIRNSLMTHMSHGCNANILQ